MKLTDFKALTFDCYGTLIDWESGMIAGLAPLVERARAHMSLDRDAILEAHARQESWQQAWTPGTNYRDILAIVYRRLAEEWSVPVGWGECDAYGRSVENWPAFPDAAESLRYLRQHYKLVILSNIDNESFAASNDRLEVTFDAVYTAQDVGAYKPADRNFDYMLNRLATLGIEKRDILHTAESLFHDHVPARRHDLATCWIYRRHAQSGFGATMHPGTLPEVDFRFDSMADLVIAHRAAMSG